MKRLRRSEASTHDGRQSSRRSSAAGPPEGVEIGDLDGVVGIVERSGTVTVPSAGCVVEWAVGAEDRWHVAHREVAVRQTLLEDAPVPATCMRVPGGDVVQRVAGISDGSGRGVLIELENQTPVPVAVGLVVRPTGSRRSPGLEISDDRVRIGDRDVLVMPRGPGGSVIAPVADVWDVLAAGPAPGDRSSSAEGVAAAVVLPLAHRAVIRPVVPIAGETSAAVPAGVVAAGWRALAARAATVEVADTAFVERWRRAVPATVLTAGIPDPARAARAALALDRVGLPDEADRARATLVYAIEQGRIAPADCGAAAVALASRRSRWGRHSGLAETIELLLGTGQVELTTEQTELVAAALDHEDPRAAADLRDRPAGPDVGRGTASPDDLAVDLLTAIDRLVAESPEGVDLLPHPAPGWSGSALDVRGLSTRHGRLSYSVRWHGERPALLWEVDGDDSIAISCSGLDGSWTTGDRRGEALLSAGRPSAARRHRAAEIGESDPSS